MTTGVIPPETVGHRLVLAREYAQLEQTQIASVLGIARTSVSNYERGLRFAKRHLLVAWATITGVDLHWLETGDRDLARPEGLEPPTFCSVVDLFGTQRHMAVAA